MALDLSHLEPLLALEITTWKRSQHLLQPKIWHKQDGFIVRDVTPDFFPFVLHHMEKYFLRDEPMGQSLKIVEDPLALAEMRILWYQLILPQRVSIVAIPEGTPGANLEEVSEDNPPSIIGVNQLFVNLKDDPPMPDLNSVLKSKKAKLCLGTLFETGAMVNVFERYQVNTCIGGVGMSVAPEWRGKSIGQFLITARNNLCKELGIPLQKTVFTAIQSQKVAVKGGFELLAERFYADLRGEDNSLLFPDMHPDQKKIQLMARRV
ncbi:uncharacterized protein LOC135945974 isoform X1 [Cloeon dipterum]|uniref:uncharacterized protein LOC135945974 isoform X1 n=1 Tax=Cloeon dipterum TaxID=197152 RepID=UPI0032202C0B